MQDRGPRGVVAGVDGQAERGLRVDRVGAGVLLGVGAQLVDEPDAATLVAAEVDDDPALAADAGQRSPAAGPAVAPERAEGVAGQALAVQARTRTGPRGPQPARADEGDVLVAGQGVAVAVGREGAVDRRDAGRREPLDPVVALAPGDEHLDGDDGQPGLAPRATTAS